MVTPKVLFTSSRKAIQLGKQIGKGGEGNVYEVIGDPNNALKIYLSGRTGWRQRKVEGMINAKLYTTTTFIAFPVEALYSDTGEFAGFSMRKILAHKPVHQLYGPTDRKNAFPKANFSFLVRAASNIAKAVASAHAQGCVIGDINHSGFLISDDATTTVIDSDSFQITLSGQQYRCKVGVPEFTPPELQGKTFAAVQREPNHDAFGLAILIFNLLMMGRHPYAGRYLGPGDMPTLDRAISENRFAYSSARRSFQMEPPPGLPSLQDMPSQLEDYFERAFSVQKPGSLRPSAADWCSALDAAEQTIIPCRAKPTHHYFKRANNCPWCRMEAAYPGFEAFGSTTVFSDPTKPVDIGQLLAGIRSTVDPGNAPSLEVLVRANAIARPKDTSNDLRRARLAKLWSGAFLALIGVGAFKIDHGGIGTAALVLGGFVAFSRPKDGSRHGAALAVAKSTWARKIQEWEEKAGNKRWLETRQEAERLVGQIQQLPTEEKSRLANLEVRKRELQLKKHLERFSIQDAKVKGIGAARKVQLSSYGINSAADVEGTRIEAIPGFGPVAASALKSWRRSVEKTFVFNASLPTDVRDVNAIRLEFAQKHALLHGKVQVSLANINAIAASVKQFRAMPDSSFEASWNSLQDAEDKVASASLKPFDLAFAGGAVAMASVIISGAMIPANSPSFRNVPSSANYSVSTPTPRQEVPNYPHAPAPTAPNWLERVQVSPPPQNNTIKPAENPEITKKLNIQDPNSGPNLVENKTVSDVPQTTELLSVPASASQPTSTAVPSENSQQVAAITPLNLLNVSDASEVQRHLGKLGYFKGVYDGVWGSRSRQALANFRLRHNLGYEDKWDVDAQRILFSGKALRWDPKSITRKPTPYIVTRFAPPVGASRNPLNMDDALWIQARLNAIGLHSNDGGGIWGEASRDALRKFRNANGMPFGDTWDAETEGALERAVVDQPTETIFGGWAPSPSQCRFGASGGPPIKIGPSGANSPGGRCDFSNVSSIGNTWTLDARCRSAGKTWLSHVKIQLNADTLDWVSEKSSIKYYRCSP